VKLLVGLSVAFVAVVSIVALASSVARVNAGNIDFGHTATPAVTRTAVPTRAAAPTATPVAPPLTPTGLA